MDGLLRLLTRLVLSSFLLLSSAVRAAECIVPSKPGGGFDLTCKLAKSAMGTSAANGTNGMTMSYLPGGIGAVAWSSVVTQRKAEPDTLVAFSGGSLLNIVLGKFGRASSMDVRWVAALGTDYGMLAVRSDSPYHNLRDLFAALKRDPSLITIGVGGTAGSQDWMKLALLAKQVKLDPKLLKIVAFEGGGEAFTAMLAGHVQVVSGDASEAALHLKQGAGNPNIRVLGVLSEARLPGIFSQTPTSHEQGFPVSWPLIRGVYMGAQVSDQDYQRWVKKFTLTMATPAFEQQRLAHGLYPFAMTGDALTAYIKTTMAQYEIQVKELGLIK